MNAPAPPCTTDWQAKLDRCRTPAEVEELIAGRAYAAQMIGVPFTIEMRQAGARRLAEVSRDAAR